MSLRKTASSLAIAAALLALSSSAQSAVLVAGPLPSNGYITHNGYDWAWANRWPHDNPNALFDLSDQAAYGWRIPTVDELAMAPEAPSWSCSEAPMSRSAGQSRCLAPASKRCGLA